MAQRKWKETKQEPGTAGTGNMLGCCLISFHFLLVILSTSTVGKNVIGQEESSASATFASAPRYASPPQFAHDMNDPRTDYVLP